MSAWETVVGLEVHVELNTTTKMWCGCSTAFDAPPNTNVCEVCTGQPGALPVLNEAAVTAAARLGLALNCSVAESCHFHRKNYFYPDLAKNYQISQYDVPLCTGGHLDLRLGGESRRVGIERLHMEEDTGKSTHLGDTGRLAGAERSLIDYNRAGVPLLEIVSEPDIRDAETARAYLRELIGIARRLGVSDARLEEGSIRCDANVSVRRPDADYGTRAEIKNLNSVRSLGRAIDHEAQRQAALLEDGGTVVQETRHWDEETGRTETLRRKETVTDYRYFPDPDLVEVTTDPAWVERLEAGLPELPAAARERLEADGVDPQQAATVVDRGLVRWYDDAVAAEAPPVEVAKWLAGDVVGLLGQAGLDPDESGLTGAHVGELVTLVEDGTLSGNLAKQVLEEVIDSRGERMPAEVAEEEGLQQVSDEDELEAIVDEVVAEDPDTVETVRDGNEKAIGALVGAVMRKTEGQADPQLTNELLRDKILG